MKKLLITLLVSCAALNAQHHDLIEEKSQIRQLLPKEFQAVLQEDATRQSMVNNYDAATDLFVRAFVARRDTSKITARDFRMQLDSENALLALRKHELA